MGVPKRSVSVPEQETHFDCLPLRDHKPPQQTKWLRVRIKEGQEERLQRLRPLLPEADPGVQGGFRYHGRRQRRSTSHRWSCFSQKRWLEVLMMTTPSLRLS